MATSTKDSKHLGLEIGQILARFLLGSDDLHYGFWPDDLEVTLENVPQAQARHSARIIANIPEGTETILDVGGGAGQLATRLTDRGYRVDVVVPSAHLAQTVRERLGSATHVFESRFEDLDTDRRYDLVLCSESFQYIDIEQGLARAAELLAPGGHFLVCDYFREEGRGRPPIRGGHRWSKFAPAIDAAPFELAAEEDRSREASRTLDLIGAFLRDVAVPVRDVVGRFGTEQHPHVTRVLRWVLRRRLAKFETRYLHRDMSAEAFLRHFTYRVLLYRRR